MKIKSLLLAGLAIMAMNAHAELYTCNSYVSLPEGYTIAPGEADTTYQELTLTRLDDNTDNFTNLQVNMYLPEGLNVDLCISHSDTKVYNEDAGRELQAVNLLTNMHPDGYYVIALLNIPRGDQVKVTKNPVKIARMLFSADETFMGGEIKAYLKYTDYANNDYVNEEFVVATIPEPVLVDVAHVATSKDVVDVKFCNVAGYVADDAFDGLNVVVTTYSDGTYSIAKVVK